MNDQQAITEIKQRLNQAIRKKDVSATARAFADESVMFVLPPPLKFVTDPGSGTKRIEEWFATFKAEIGLESKDFQVLAGEDIAFTHCLDRLTGERTDGSNTDLWYRETLGLRKTKGEWKIVHQHQSVPMYMDGTGRAATDLTPYNNL